MIARRPVFAANWKMNTTVEEGEKLCEAVRLELATPPDADIVLCPPYTHLVTLHATLGGSPLALGAQNMHWEPNGAFTGEVSPAMLAGLVSHVILGHSERRQYFGEIDEDVHRKVEAAFGHGLIPVVCVGETAAQRGNGETQAVLARQLHGGLEGTHLTPAIIIAYEPIWAIGTSTAAHATDAQEAIAFLRNELRTIAGAAADEIRILYGGSVSPANIEDFLSEPDIDGGLVGGASLSAASFARIVFDGSAAAARRRPILAESMYGTDVSRLPLVVILGQTASGKSKFAVELAEAIGGEIVSADSRQVYRGMDLGTGKIRIADRRGMPHHLIDIVDPDSSFGLADFCDLATGVVAAIRARGHTPILAGGTAQYVWAVVEGWEVPRVPPDNDFRAALTARATAGGAEALHAELAALDPAAAAAIHPHNVRRVVRALEIAAETGVAPSMLRARRAAPAAALLFGLSVARPELHRRIDERVETMFRDGLVDEVEGLLRRGYAPSLPSMSGIGYTQVVTLLDGAISLDEAKSQTKAATRRLARQQSTWFRPADDRIRWLDRGPLQTALSQLAATPAGAIRTGSGQ